LAKNQGTNGPSEREPFLFQISKQVFLDGSLPVGVAKNIHFFQAVKKGVSWEGYAPEGYQDYKENLIFMSPNLHKTYFG
jgi:hypothetical protein